MLNYKAVCDLPTDKKKLTTILPAGAVSHLKCICDNEYNTYHNNNA